MIPPRWLGDGVSLAHAFDDAPGIAPRLSLCETVAAGESWSPVSAGQRRCHLCQRAVAEAKALEARDGRRAMGMVEWWDRHKRRLTAFEQSLRDQRRCVTCGQPVLVVETRSRKMWPFECKECRQPLPSAECHPGLGSLQVAREYRRRLGYSPGTSGAESAPDREEER